MPAVSAAAYPADADCCCRSDTRRRRPGPRGASRAALAADPDRRMRLLQRLRIEDEPSNLRTGRRSAGVVLGPHRAERVHVLVGHRAAFGERRGDTASNSAFSQPAPMPTTSRPPDSTSIVASILAASTAGRCGTTITASTIRMCVVLAAIQATPTVARPGAGRPRRTRRSRNRDSQAVQVGEERRGRSGSDSRSPAPRPRAPPAFGCARRRQRRPADRQVRRFRLKAAGGFG